MSVFPVHGRRLFENRKILQSSAPIGPSVEGREGSREFPYVYDAGFDSILAVMATILFCSLLCSLGVSALLRCRLLCRRWRLVSEPSLDVVVQRAQNGIKKMDIKSLPATIYRTDSPLRSMDCPICLAEFVEGERVRVLPECSHSFHAECIDTWLLSNPSCPSCRHSLLDVLLKKPAGFVRPGAAESAECDRMHVNEGNESVETSHVVQPFHISGDSPTIAASPSLDFIKSSELESTGDLVETRRP